MTGQKAYLAANGTNTTLNEILEKLVTYMMQGHPKLAHYILYNDKCSQ